MIKVNQLKMGSILSYVQMGLSCIINLLYTPLMIRILGQSEYGLYQTVSSTISILSILSLGFNAGYVRFFAKYKAKDDQESIFKLNGLFLIVFSVIGVVALICGMFLTFHLDMVFASGLTQKEYRIATVLMFLLTINLAETFFMTVFQMIITANERFVILKLIGMLRTVLSPLLTIPLLLMGYGSVAIVLITIMISFISDGACFFYVKYILKQKFIFHHFEKGLFRSVLIYTSFIAINIIVDQINQNIDKVLLSRYKGTSATAVYSVAFTLYSLYQTLSCSVSNVFIPRIHGIVAKTENNIVEQKEKLTTIFIKVGRIQYLILGLIATGIIFFGKEFIINFWAGSGYEDSYYVALLLILPGTIPLVQNLGIEIQRAENKHQFRSILYLFMALVNLGLSIVLCQKYGAIGSAIGTAISYILANGFIMNIYYHKQCNIDVLKFWKNIIEMTRGIIPPVIVGIIISRIFIFSNFIIFCIGVFFYTIIYSISVWKFSMNKFEKDLIISLIRPIWNKWRNDA